MSTLAGPCHHEQQAPAQRCSDPFPSKIPPSPNHHHHPVLRRERKTAEARAILGREVMALGGYPLNTFAGFSKKQVVRKPEAFVL